ncbi:MAG: hypothetical protein R2729_11985 [Bryobacteraceae bacterium]
MTGHVRALGVVFLIYGLLLFCFGLIGLVLFGGLSALFGVSLPTDSIAAPIADAMGGILFGLCTVLALPKFFAAYGLLRLRRWGRTLGLILCFSGMLEFPIGTAVGAYGAWVLLSREGARIFADSPGAGQLG